MKKLALLFSMLLMGIISQAQLSLSGTSYTQNFNNLSGGLPIGWSVRIKASSTFLGIDSSNGFIANATGASASWTSTTGGFKNLASANAFLTFASGTTAAQQAATDRPLGVRQVAQTSGVFPSDTGVAFVLQIANTTTLSNFSLSFKLQGLDSMIARVSNWVVDYGIGNNPTTFIPVNTIPVSPATGSNTFSNSIITANFGNALNNNPGPVWIRIVNLTGTSGAGSRPTTGIDDYTLSWSGSAAGSVKPNVVLLTPADNSSNVATSSNLTITFDRNISKGAGNIYVKNRTTQNTQTIAASSSNVAASGTAVTVSGVVLAMGTTYHVTFDSTAFDTAGFNSFGIYDTTDWDFTTVFPTPTVLNELFDISCGSGVLPSGWSRQNVTGTNQQWGCAGAGVDKYMQMNGAVGNPTTHNDNEDWLISPMVNLTGVSNPQLNFEAYKGFSGTDLEVSYATNYTGTGNPNVASWTNLNINFAGATNSWASYSANLPAQQLYVAFKYACSQSASNCAQWRVDSIVTTGTSSIVSAKENNQFSVVVYGKASAQKLTLAYAIAKAEVIIVSVYDLTGRELFREAVNAKAGVNQTTIAPALAGSGMYIIKVAAPDIYGVTKAIIE
ncbi:MAG TPA: Ig-like domain-containing protein [Flavipsychrobacter sp.]|nr:Ig-like domain-containing protein [Flavipsychrobacter sp.]